MEVDFVIIAALKDEALEIGNLLGDKEQQGAYIVGTVKGAEGVGAYRVAIVNLYDGMGPSEAGPATQGAIADLKPRAVLMTGIAAGFEDSQAKVELGDLMIPAGIVNYETAKIKGKDERGPAEVQHRALAWAVSEWLWRTAATTAEDRSQPWLQMMTVTRPDEGNAPKIHVGTDSVLGSGEKVIADEEAEARKWLLETYPRQALGLEMESSASLRVCRLFDTPFLVAKAAVDRATVRKDDRWRTYACQLSAAFLLTVIERYDKPQPDLVRDHVQQCRKTVETISRTFPTNDFGYKLRTAASFEQLRQGIYLPGEGDLSTLVPSDIHVNVVLYSGGGAGKTTVMRRLFCEVSKLDFATVLVDLKRYSQEYEVGEAESGDRSNSVENIDIDSILKVATSPKRTSIQLEQLAMQAKLLLLIDGVNEVSKPAQTCILAFCQKLRRGPGCHTVWANRMTSIESLRPEPVHATLTGVPEDVAARLFDGEFGAGSFAGLSDRLRVIYQRPFFLDLAIRAHRPFTVNRLWSGIFSEFFRQQLAISDFQVDHLARATRDSIGPDGKMLIGNLRESVGDTLWHNLEAAQVGVVGESGFGHHLWRDYLVARALKLDSDHWAEDVFDRVTTLSTSYECLTMAVEQIPSSTEKVAFVDAVYDWSYVAALECIATMGDDEEVERRVPAEVRQAILAAVAEKQFDPVERTRQRTRRVLEQYPFAQSVQAASSRQDIVAGLRHLRFDGELANWFRLFSQTSPPMISDEDLDLVSSTNSLVGWAAANFIRRGTLSLSGEERMRAIYDECRGNVRLRSRRWRVVHALGTHLSDDNISFLIEVFDNDEYHWVVYGAARSLVEIASKIPNIRRQAAVDALIAFAKSDRGGRFRGAILREIVETCFIDEPSKGWAKAIDPLLDVVASKAPSEMRSNLASRIHGFRNKNIIDPA